MQWPLSDSAEGRVRDVSGLRSQPMNRSSCYSKEQLLRISSPPDGEEFLPLLVEEDACFQVCRRTLWCEELET
jgi:hypothetical protein